MNEICIILGAGQEIKYFKKKFYNNLYEAGPNTTQGFPLQ